QGRGGEGGDGGGGESSGTTGDYQRRELAKWRVRSRRRADRRIGAGSRARDDLLQIRETLRREIRAQPESQRRGPAAFVHGTLRRRRLSRLPRRNLHAAFRRQFVPDHHQGDGQFPSGARLRIGKRRPRTYRSPSPAGWHFVGLAIPTRGGQNVGRKNERRRGRRRIRRTAVNAWSRWIPG